MTEHLYDEVKALRETLKKTEAERDRVALQLKTESTAWGARKAQFEEAQRVIVAKRDELKLIVIDLIKHRDAGCGCDAHPPDACEWHGPLRRASRAVNYFGP